MGRSLDTKEAHVPNTCIPVTKNGARPTDPYLTRRRFLHGSAMAPAGGVLFSCTGGKVIPKLGDRTAEIDTATPIKRPVRDARTAASTTCGKFPGVEGTTVGVELGKEKPLIRCPEWLPGDIPHDRAAHLNCLNGDKMDGFGNGEFGSTYAYSIFDEDQIPNYYTGARVLALRPLLRERRRTVVPEPLLLHRRAIGRRARQPENIETRVEGGQRFKSWGCDALMTTCSSS